MKPLLSRTEDSGALKDLGRASIQIVHDLKNQLNGLKLYATFLRKRIEKGDRPEDELETINKLIGGLDRAANDLSTITQYTRDIELKKQPGFDLQKVLRGICSEMTNGNDTCVFESEAQSLTGEFDHLKLTDSLRWISAGVIKHHGTPEGVTLSSKRVDAGDSALIEWSGPIVWDHDPLKSFAGTDEIKMSLAAKIIETHGGIVRCEDKTIIVTLPL